MAGQEIKQRALLIGTVSEEMLNGLRDRCFDAKKSQHLAPKLIGEEAWEENRVMIVDDQELGWTIFKSCRSPRALKLEDSHGEELIDAAAQMLSSSHLSQYDAFVNLRAAPIR
jgi:hypothetical protein